MFRVPPLGTDKEDSPLQKCFQGLIHRYFLMLPYSGRLFCKTSFEVGMNLSKGEKMKQRRKHARKIRLCKTMAEKRAKKIIPPYLP